MRFRIMSFRLALALLSVVGSYESASANFTVTYDFTGEPGNQVSTPGIVSQQQPGVATVSAISRGPGLTASAGSNSINSSGFSTGAIDLGDYYGFSVTPSAGSRLDLDALTFSSRRSGTGVTAVSVRTSLDNFAANVFTLSLPDTTVTRRDTFAFGSAFDSVSSPLEVRIYGFQAEAAGGTWRLGVSAGADNPNNLPANLTLSGVATTAGVSVVTPLPPTAVAALIVTLLAGLRRVRAVR